jgi:hypothetical protein
MADPEKTGEKRKPVPPVEHQFKPGNPGRPKGSRNKLGEAFVQALHDDFQTHGVSVIAIVREERPHEYLKVVASLLPKQVEIKEDAFGDLTDEQLAAVLASVTAALGAEGEAGTGDSEEAGSQPAQALQAVH